MKRLANSVLSLLCLLGGAACGRVQKTEGAAAQGQTTRGTAAVIRFPEDWQEEREGVEQLQHAYIENLELRRSPQGLPGEYLVAGFSFNDDYSHEYQKDIPPPNYTANIFAVDFDAGMRVRRAQAGEWESARRVSRKPHWLMLKYDPDVERRDFTYRGFRYTKRGQHWSSPVLLSPSGKWFAVFSYSGRKTKPDLIFGGGEPRRGDVFWDVYDAFTGERVAAWEARGVSDPASFRKAEAWLDERHLLVPADARARSYVVFTLPEFTPPENPGTVRFNGWEGEDGAPMRLPDPRQDASVERAERKLEARMLEDASRPGARELLFRIKDEWVVRLPPQPPRGREGLSPGGLRLQTAHSRSLYAVTLEGEYQVRAASLAEWESARKVEAKHNAVNFDATYDSFGGPRRITRPFTKSGAEWGTPRALGGEWLAVFSYTPITRAAGAARAIDADAARGELHVEVYDAPPGDLIVAARRPYTVSPGALFSRALWLDGHFLVLPLDESYNSLLLWLLPETNGML